MVEDRPAGIGRLARAGVIAKVTRQMIFTHALVGAERDDHRHLIGPACQGTVSCLQQQRQRAGPGAVRDHQTDPLTVEISLGESGADETADRIRRKLLTDAADGGRTRWVTRIRPIVPV